MIPKKILAGAIAALAISALNGFGLEWETKRISIAATPEQESAEGVFAFTNNSDQPVTIKSVRSSCGCTVTELEKREYLPGESGEIKALFTFGTRTGAQRKTISVVTDATGEEKTSLLLDVSIPELIRIKPFFVFWRKGDALEPKKIELRVSDPDLIRPISIEANNERFDAVLESTGDRAVFTVTITPRSTEVSGNSHFLVTTDYPTGKPRVVRVYAGIR
ncbi:MAG: hypothetical protein DRP71_11295 [Verrucomicrobia bacterium]|nr:MAG: hypothetical protein DRP71_11295 [Verrucomicrobiota bacterium]